MLFIVVACLQSRYLNTFLIDFDQSFRSLAVYVLRENVEVIR